MIKVGDKVVCIHNEKMLSASGSFLLDYKPELILYNIYTVDNIGISSNIFSDDMNVDLLSIEGFKNYYNIRRFATLKEYRKQKIKKLNNYELF